MILLSKQKDGKNIARQIAAAVSEYDAAMLIGMPENEYSKYMQTQTAVSKGADFIYNNLRYQVKANRPSGKPRSKVTLVPKAKNYEWDIFIWLLYDKHYVLLEAWQWDVNTYKSAFEKNSRLSPADYRQGKKLI